MRLAPYLLVVALAYSQCQQLAAQNIHPLVESGKVLPRAGQMPIDDGTRAAACAPATAIRDLEWNNIEALIETGGSMWQDRATGRSHYYAPKGGNVSVLFAGSLWMGGLSPDQQLKLAAIQYRYEGNDYWAGPLSNDGSAEITEASCEDWDDFVVSYRTDAQRHRQYFECSADPNCDMEESFPDGYSIPAYFLDYPAHGNTAFGQDFYLAPFYDFDDNGIYDPQAGDYPWFDFTQEIVCAERKREDKVPLFGDQNYYWIFNDKGNIHSESLGQPIGMEIRAQAFAFSTNDEINNMTFYNYVLINQGTQTLTNTYFGTWIDCDIGGHVDDYVGCDVQRGLGYGYNGYANDGPSSLSFGYGENPPAVGVDFFEGPYQDADNKDNPLTTDINLAIEEDGIPYKGIGIGYGDGIADNERFGMRKFLYHISGSGNNGAPELAVHYYNYLRGYWKNGQRMAYGGNALSSSSGANLDTPADFMFPGDTDPYNFGTLGAAVDPWTEVSSDNPPSDRRFMQSAGPFTLAPGDYNNITVGVVFARATSGDPFASVELVRQADDKAQALFDNCFELISGPDAPKVVVQELENELILFLTNDGSLSSNANEAFQKEDPTIPEFDSNGDVLTPEQRSYYFQGYLVYQLANAEVSSSELEDVDKARLIAQCDIKDGVSNIINYEKDPVTNQVVARLKVQGADEGIRHSFRVTEDAFASGNSRLVNHKTYYFMALAYGYNNYEPYSFSLGTGQDEAFLASRKSASGAIEIASGIPHKVSPEALGTIAQSSYGYNLPLLQIEGTGNATNFIAMDKATENEILDNGVAPSIQYTSGNSPVQVQIIDPLRVPEGDFDLRLASQNEGLTSDTAFWQLTNTTTGEVYDSKHSIHLLFEELMLHWGISVTWNQYGLTEKDVEHYTDLIDSDLEFENPEIPWLFGIPDDDSFTPFNWIRAGGTYVSPVDNPTEAVYNDYDDGASNSGANTNYFTDKNEAYEGVIQGLWSPYCLVGPTVFLEDENQWFNPTAPTNSTLDRDLSPLQHKYVSNIKGLNNVDVVLTRDSTKWTRVPVFEMQHLTELSEGNVEKMQMRDHASIDKNGVASGSPGCNEAQATLNGTQPKGMSWFPGYAIDVSTGERLNMAFGEDSWLLGENGRDMIWNPTSRYANDLGTEYLFGGQHWIYVFKNVRKELDDEDFMPAYDYGQFVYSKRDNDGELATGDQEDIFMACTWVGSAILNPNFEFRSMKDGLIPCDVRLRMRVAKPFVKYDDSISNTENYTGASNWWNSRFTFTTRGLQTITNDHPTLESVLDVINVVPNPYYAFSSYEANKLDNRIKITNLPQQCTVSIFDMSGTLVRQFEKGDPVTSLDWDLKNSKNIPVASGTYIIHVKVPGVGEKILKWFGVMRPIDLDNF
jgi:hypothetical protein